MGGPAPFRGAWPLDSGGLQGGPASGTVGAASRDGFFIVQTEMLKAAQGPTPFTIPPEKAVEYIWNAMKKCKQVIYTPPIWRWIMLAIQLTPSFIFRRLSF